MDLWAPCRSKHHWGLCSETLSQSFLASPCLQEHAFISLLLLITVCAQGRRVVTGAPAESPPPLSLLPAQALCENLLWSPPEWGWLPPGAWRPHLHLPMKDNLCKIKCNFNLRAFFEELVSLIASEACVRHRGSINAN